MENHQHNQANAEVAASYTIDDVKAIREGTYDKSKLSTCTKIDFYLHW
jgi:hypothetical protein